MVFEARNINAVRKAQKKYREKRRLELAQKAKEIRERKKVETEKNQQLIAQFKKAGVERRKERLEMLNIIKVMIFTFSRTNLTDSEKVAKIKEITMSKELSLSMLKLLKRLEHD